MTTGVELPIAISVRYSSGAYRARVVNLGKTASSTNCAKVAAEVVAAKVFGAGHFRLVEITSETFVAKPITAKEVA